MENQSATQILLSKKDYCEQLHFILNNKELCFEFKMFMHARKCDENLFFWFDVELFRNDECTTDEKVFEKALILFDKYFAEKAKFPLNLDSDITSEVIGRIEAKDVSRDLFDDAQKSIFKMMETACVTKFIEELRTNTVSSRKFCIFHFSHIMTAPHHRKFVRALRALRKTKSEEQRSSESLNMHLFFDQKVIQREQNIQQIPIYDSSKKSPTLRSNSSPPMPDPAWSKAKASQTSERKLLRVMSGRNLNL